VASRADRLGWAERLLLAGDGFLFAGATVAFLVMLDLGLGALMGLRFLDPLQAALPASPLTGAVSGALFMLSVLGAALVAWRMHGRQLTWGSAGGLLVAFVVAAGVSLAAWFGLFSLRLVASTPTGSWPQLTVLVLVALLLGVPPAVDAVRDVPRTHRAHMRLDWIRLAALAVLVIPAVFFEVRGIDVIEPAAFIMPGAITASLAVAAVDLALTLRGRRQSSADHKAATAA
jgi:hypothetical protein